MQSRKLFEILKHKALLFYSFVLLSKFSFQGFQWGNFLQFLHSRVQIKATFTLLRSRKHDFFKDSLYFLYSWKIFLIARNTLFLITKALEIILYSVVLAKPLEEFSNLKLPRNLLGNPSQLPDNTLPALLKEQCSSRLTLALQSFLALPQPPPSKNSAPLIPLAASSYHTHNECTKRLPGSPGARDFYSTSRIAFLQGLSDVLPTPPQGAAAVGEAFAAPAVCRLAVS